ncbi:MULTISPECIES: hypothetical protein [Halobellus]|jgi:hypothetical protein|uniref:hypothetical protein n=1 Tax=Halobellus TaxID=1073986 RepID=UPI000EF211E8|nr:MULTISPECIES: hypothetical protein [Halobellus]MDQ2053546.1 hypothetical protein [Halobellus sp. H-GB7]RLM94705.1 hypothetical protein D3D02_01575 [Halobellus sp. Atlit-38R]
MTEEETDEPTVPIVCEECGTTSRVALSQLRTSLEKHNEHRHDGEEIAQVDPVIADELANAVADDLGLLDEE